MGRHPDIASTDQGLGGHAVTQDEIFELTQVLIARGRRDLAIDLWDQPVSLRDQWLQLHFDQGDISESDISLARLKLANREQRQAEYREFQKEQSWKTTAKNLVIGLLVLIGIITVLNLLGIDSGSQDENCWREPPNVKVCE